MIKKNIRNFCIIAHIDHGKSTLADRLIEMTGSLEKRLMKDQYLDSMELEQEKGITIKLAPTTMLYKKDGKEYTLNLIDTPGHVDFTYEVSRSLAACEGAILVVDAAQGVEAQTVANAYLAAENDLEIIPVINKVDLPSARPDEVKKEIEDVIGIDASNAPMISAKEGKNIESVLDIIVDKVPPPENKPDKPLKALIFDSSYDNYKGAVSIIRIYEGVVRPGDKIKMMSNEKTFDVVDVGIFTPREIPVKELGPGDVGYLSASIKNIDDTKVGDTITLDNNPADKPLPGYKEVKPMVYSSIFLADGSKYNDLKDGLERLRLNDSSLSFEKEVSSALGFGFRCGFLGLLHMEIIKERLEREYDLDIITTAPSVSYVVHKINGEKITVSNPVNYPQPEEIDAVEEPIVNMNIFTPPDYIGNIMALAQDRRAIQKDMKYIDKKRVMLMYEIPLNEIIYDFFDKLKSHTRGYASLEYEMSGYQKSDLTKMDILLNGEATDALSMIVHKTKAYERGKHVAKKLKEVIPRHMFEIPIQASIGKRVVARETVKALKKDVLSKCYGGDITRKKKLLEKQKQGKKKMRQIGKVEIPSDAFISVLKSDDE